MPLSVEKRGVHVEVPDDRLPGLTPTFTLRIWCQPYTMADEPGYQREPGWPALLAKSRTWNNGFGFYGTPDGKIRFYLNEWGMFYVEAQMTMKKWVCLVVTYEFRSDGGVLRIYKDGKLADSKTNLPPMKRNDVPLCIGSTVWGDQGWYAWHGAIGPLSIWDRTFSPEEAAKASASAAPIKEGLVLHLELDETEGQQAKDRSGLGNNGVFKDSLTTVNRKDLPAFEDAAGVPWRKPALGSTGVLVAVGGVIAAGLLVALKARGR